MLQLIVNLIKIKHIVHWIIRVEEQWLSRTVCCTRIWPRTSFHSTSTCTLHLPSLRFISLRQTSTNFVPLHPTSLLFSLLRFASLHFTFLLDLDFICFEFALLVKCPYLIQNGPCPSSGIQNSVKHNVSEMGCVSVFTYYIGSFWKD
jgi:hypothetical protein